MGEYRVRALIDKILPEVAYMHGKLVEFLVSYIVSNLLRMRCRRNIPLEISAKCSHEVLAWVSSRCDLWYAIYSNRHVAKELISVRMGGVTTRLHDHGLHTHDVDVRAHSREEILDVSSSTSDKLISIEEYHPISNLAKLIQRMVHRASLAMIVVHTFATIRPRDPRHDAFLLIAQSVLFV